jgi:hypothetical protein
VARRIHILEVPVSNLSLDTGSPVNFVMIFSVVPRKLWDSNLKQVATSLFQLMIFRGLSRRISDHTLKQILTSISTSFLTYHS